MSGHLHWKQLCVFLRKLGDTLLWLGKIVGGPRIETFHYPSPDGKTHWIEVRNAGGGIPLCRVWLYSVTDARGTMTGHVTSEVEIYWSNTVELMHLSGHKRGLAAVMSLLDDGNLQINTIISCEEGNRRQGRFVIAAPTKEIRLFVRIEFKMKVQKLGDQVKDEIIGLRVKPMSSGGYEVEEIEDKRTPLRHPRFGQRPRNPAW